MMSTCDNDICNNVSRQWQTLTCVVWCHDEALIKCYVKCEVWGVGGIVEELFNHGHSMAIPHINIFYMAIVN
jgi:hypothetical protein